MSHAVPAAKLEGRYQPKSPVTTTAPSGGSARPGTIRDERRREARLRAEHAHRYPGLAVGRWEPAATLADRVLACRLLRCTDAPLGGRLLLEQHFDFRGGLCGPPDGPGRPRREDR